jgi:hypothetical protein
MDLSGGRLRSENRNAPAFEREQCDDAEQHREGDDGGDEAAASHGPMSYARARARPNRYDSSPGSIARARRD